ncbi:hypothetical protein POPTR_014G091200v4 [Populus trichocarpa]|uniref:RNA uridylyltransferase n=1 Tax=Populus trichocarpa TaxID=3694 RepID=A0A2K1XRS9_POPTR|nr:hypothetical protein POPTR_014G091200v4 [Populus trichocarpa]
MAEQSENPIESVMGKISEKIHHESSSSDSESDSEKKSYPSESVKDKIWRLFGREKPVHRVLGGGKPADVFLWRNKKVSAGVLGFATAIWVLFELVEYNLLTLVCHILILSLALSFLWSNAHSFINKSPPRIPQVHLPEEPVLQVASALCVEINGYRRIVGHVNCGELVPFLDLVLYMLRSATHCTRSLREVRGQNRPLGREGDD